MAETTAESKSILEAIKVLEKLEAAGSLRPEEKSALEKLRAREADAKFNADRTNATYRGAAQGATFGAGDEIGAFLRNPQSAISGTFGGDGTAYQEDLAETRGRNLAAQTRFPEEYKRGEMAGGIGTAALPTAGVMRGTRQLGTLGKMGYGLLSGALAGGAYGFNTGEGGALPRLANAAMPAAVGGLVGLAAPAIAYGTAHGIRGLQNLRRSIPGYGGRSTTAMTRAIGRNMKAGADPLAISRYGREAMIADIPGAPRTTAQGLATMGGEGADTLRRALEDRAQGASGRIVRDVDQVMGAADDAFNQRAALAAERTGKLGPEYQAATASRDLLKASDIRAAVTGVKQDAASNVSAAADRIMRELGDTDGITPARLHNIRTELSDEIQAARQAGRKKFATQMQPVLEAIDEKLDTVPGYMEARTGWANNMAMEEAIDEGRKVFTGGATTAMSPKELEKKLAGMSEAQREAFRKGAREWVSALMGTARNDSAAAVREVQKGWTADKIKILFGDKEGQQIINRIEAEQLFSQTRGDVLKGSQTDFRAGARADLADLATPDGSQRPGIIRRGLNAVNDAGNAAVDSILYAGRPQANLEVGRMLAAQGPERDALLRDLMMEAAIRGKPTNAQRLTQGLLDYALRSGGTAAAISQN